MSNLRDIKKRLVNISLLENVTQSMKSIASTSLSHAKARKYANKDYYEASEDVLQKLFYVYSKSQDSSSEWLNILFANNQKVDSNNDNKTLLIVVSADRGLCGAYNSFVFKKASERISKIGEQNVIVCPIGRKSQVFLNKNQNKHLEKIDFNLSSNLKKLDYDNLMLLAHFISKKLSEGIFNSIEVVYCYNKTALEQDIKSRVMIPIALEKEVEDANQKSNLVADSVEISQDITEIVKKYMSFALYDILAEASIAEFTSRLNAMSNANDNCNELKKSLHLEYNRTRQGVITKELIEIISGAESL